MTASGSALLTQVTNELNGALNQSFVSPSSSPSSPGVSVGGVVGVEEQREEEEKREGIEMAEVFSVEVPLRERCSWHISGRVKSLPSTFRKVS